MIFFGYFKLPNYSRVTVLLILRIVNRNSLSVFLPSFPKYLAIRFPIVSFLLAAGGSILPIAAGPSSENAFSNHFIRRAIAPCGRSDPVEKLPAANALPGRPESPPDTVPVVTTELSALLIHLPTGLA
jgi:hypothetical protein